MKRIVLGRTCCSSIAYRIIRLTLAVIYLLYVCQRLLQVLFKIIRECFSRISICELPSKIFVLKKSDYDHDYAQNNSQFLAITNPKESTENTFHNKPNHCSKLTISWPDRHNLDVKYGLALTNAFQGIRTPTPNNKKIARIIPSDKTIDGQQFLLFGRCCSS